ncbi:hypothetical protein JRQ81_019665 [Phrynocephalus forsythii]|uniref:Borealin n=1 Tax=Phrynocephalus forsythii TaxID=171643 RepID=A0A9Q1AY68_9SAUR|nr:hypothetical protein JRQ81_019665 [Phrynocephalus forsythii]
MAPSRKKASSRGAGGKTSSSSSLRSRRGEALLKDFDREVKKRLEEVRVSAENLQKEVSNMYNMEVLRLPVALREMPWLSYLALGGNEKALERVALGGLDILEITRLASEAIQTPIKTVKKAKKVKQGIETIEEEEGSERPVLPEGKRSRQEKEAAQAEEASLQKPGKVKRSTRQGPASKRSRPPSARSNRYSKRPSKGHFFTPVGQGGHGAAATRGTTPLPTPRFDSSIFKTPGLRTPAAHERVFSISANGSPLADSGEIFITLPVGGGESLRVRASELSREDLLRLNPDTLGSVEKLSAEILHLCSSVRRHK